MQLGIAVSLAVCMLMGADAPENDSAKNREEALQGIWQLSSGEADGKRLLAKQLKGGKLVIKKAQYAVTLADGATVTGTQKLDSTQGLKTIDITDASDSNEVKTCLGIYEIKGDEFRVVFARPGDIRPSKFATLPDSGQWMHVWKRVKE